MQQVGCEPRACCETLACWSVVHCESLCLLPQNPAKAKRLKARSGFHVVAELKIAPYRAMDQHRDRSPRGRSGDRSGISEDWSPTPARVKFPV